MLVTMKKVTSCKIVIILVVVIQWTGSDVWTTNRETFAGDCPSQITVTQVTHLSSL